MWTEINPPVIRKVCKWAQARLHHTTSKEFSGECSESSIVSVLEVLIAIPVVSSLIRWNWTGWWLPYKKWQAACSFRETEIMEQSCCHNAETTDPVCFFPVGGRLQLSSFHRSTILIFPYYLNFHLQGNTFPCTFRAVQGTPGLRTGSVPFAEQK